MILPALILLVLALALAYYLDMRRQDEVERTVSNVLSPEAQATLDEITAVVEDQNLILGDYFDSASRLRAVEEHFDAVSTLNEGVKIIEEAAPDYLSRLRALARLARTVSAIVSLPPVAAYAYRSLRLRGFAGLTTCLHVILVTGAERVRLRLWFIIKAFRLTLSWLTLASIKAAARPKLSAAQWQHVEDLICDLETTRNASLATAHRIVQALDAVRARQRGAQ